MNFPDEIIEQGDKGKDNGGTAEMKDDDPEWFKNFKAERAMNYPEEEVIEEEEEELFPDQEHGEPLDPSQMVVGTLFPNKKAFQRHLRAYCVHEEHEYKVKKKK